MTAIFLSTHDRHILCNALNSRAVDIMRLVNDSYVTCDPDRVEEVREKLYDELDDVDAMLDRLHLYD